MEMQQTHCYATELLRYYGNAIKVHRSCHQGNPTCNNIVTLFGRLLGNSPKQEQNVNICNGIPGNAGYFS
jgi:hypothetical protein